MLTLNDGRKELYQWDTGRTAKVDIECDVIHFSNLKYGESLAVEVKEGVVDIPNKLLTSGAPIYCWAFAKDVNGAYTKKEQILDVIKRAKPSDYVYTETEVITIQTAVENALEEAKESGEFKGDKGDKGDDGQTPYIKDGYWWIGDTNTNVKAEGADGRDGKDGANGKTPYIQDGYWYIGGVNTYVKAEGTDGEDGADGKSAYDLAVENGYKGTLVEWLASLVGETGAAGKDGADGKDGTSVTISNVSESTEDGGNNVVTFSDGKTLTVKNGKTGATGAAGANGTSVTVSSVSESTADGGENVVTFSDGETLTVKNGSKGSQGEKGDKGDTGTVQATPLFANSIDECTDTTKLYVLPDGYIYAYMTKSVTHTPTNQVPNSKAADGTPYNGGQGYKDNTRLSLSTGESSQNGYTVTGFIPVKVGDTIRFKNVNTSSSSTNVFVIFYDSSHNYVGYLRAAQATEILSAGICVLDDALTLTSGTLDGTAFFRVSMVTNNQADYFFTINELTEPTIVTEEGWFSTGHAFVPADYEDRIIGLEARVDDIADDTNNAPTYVANEAKRVSDVVKGKQTVGSLTFSAMSDMHIRTNDSYWADNVTSCRDAGLGLAELQKHLRLDFSALLGDYTVGGASDTVEKVKQDISVVKAFMSKGQKGIPNLWLTGNHDINYGASSDRRMTEDEMFAYITNNNNCTVQDFDNIGRNYGYIDFDNQRIRCIYLNTVDSLDYPDNVGSADDNSEVTAIQTQWLADVGLNLTAKSDAAEWGIVLFSHHCLSIFPHATTILTAYRNGESGSVNVTTNGVTTAVDYDFTTANRGEIICAIHGHDHNFTARKISNERWDMITPANAWLWSICIPNIDTKRNNEKATNSDAAYRDAFGEFDEQGNPVY